MPEHLFNTIAVLDIPIFNGNIDSAASIVVDQTLFRQHTNPLLISATDAHGLILSKTDPSFAKILKSFYIRLPDGVPTVWIGKLHGSKTIGRCYGPDFFAAIMMKSAQKHILHYFLGGKKDVANKLRLAVEKKFGNKNVIGTFSPPFRSLKTNEFRIIGNHIDSLKADIVWIGISTPKQEHLAVQLSNFCHAAFIITVGAAFDFHTNTVPQAPLWMQNNGLEWLFRIYSEPKRLVRRYIKTVPLFIYYNLIDCLKNK